MNRDHVYLCIILFIIFVQEACSSALPYFKCNVGSYYTTGKKGCLPCKCNEIGSESPICNLMNGSCYCKTGYKGLKCNLCAVEYYKDPFGRSCLPCICNRDGSKSIECTKTGQCQCKPNTDGKRCNRCLNSRQNFGKDCMENCPEMYNEIADNFDTFLKDLNELEMFINKSNFRIDLIMKIRYLKRLILKNPSIDMISNRLRDILKNLQEEIRSYVHKSKDVNELLGIMKKILGEFEKIMQKMQSGLEVCSSACKNMQIYDENRDNFLNELSDLKYAYAILVKVEETAEEESKMLKAKVLINNKRSLQIYDNVTVTEVPAFEDTFSLLEKDKLRDLISKLDVLNMDVEKLAETFEKTKVLQEDYLLQNAQVLNVIVSSPIPEINITITNILKKINEYEDVVKNRALPGHLSTENLINFQQYIQREIDRLDKYKILIEKYMLDDQYVKEKVNKISSALDDLILIEEENGKYLSDAEKKLKEFEESVEFDYERIEKDLSQVVKDIETKTEKLEDDLKDFDEGLLKTQVEIGTLEEVLEKLEMIRFLSGEVQKLKIISGELDQLDEIGELCVLPPPSLS